MNNRQSLFFLFMVQVVLLSVCLRQESPRVLVVRHSTRVDGSEIAIKRERSVTNRVPIDATLERMLLSFDVVPVGDTTADICRNFLYYYGYFSIDSAYMAALFEQSICSRPGETRLVMAVMNGRGNITDACIVALYTSPAECRGEKVTHVLGRDVTTVESTECFIKDGPQQGSTQLDSVTTLYHISPKGKLELLQKSSVQKVR